jgi:hypothetical protein
MHALSEGAHTLVAHEGSIVVEVEVDCPRYRRKIAEHLRVSIHDFNAALISGRN